MKIFKFIVLSFIAWLAIAFIALNVSWFAINVYPNISTVNDITSFKLQLVIFDILNSEHSKALTVTNIVFVVIIAFYVITYIEHNLKLNQSKLKSKYERTNYSRLMSNFERSRGTQRVKFNSHGEPSYRNIEEYFTVLKNPLAKLQNMYADWRLLPATKRWNVIKHYEVDGVKSRVTGGVPIMATRKYFMVGRYNQFWYLPGDHHSLFVGSTGRGKTMTYVLAMIFSYINAGESLVIHDPKGEIYAHMKDYLKENSYDTINIDFVDQESSDSWNPLDVAYKSWKRAISETEERLKRDCDYVEDKKGNYYVNKLTGEIHLEKELYKISDMSEAIEQVLDIANIITYDQDAQNPFWHEGAGDMVAGAALFLMEHGVDELVNFKSIKYLIQLGKAPSSSNPKITILEEYLNEHRDVDSYSREKLSTFLTAEGVTRSSLTATFNNKMSLLTATPAIEKMVATTSFDFAGVFKKKTAVFLITHDEKTTYYPLVSMFFKQLYEVGIKVTRTNPNRRLAIPMNWVIDEMAQLAEIKDIEAIYGAARSRGVRINAFIQTFDQLQEKYGDNVANIIEDNSTNVIYLGSMTSDTRERFSNMAGEELYWNKTKKEYVSRPVLTSERLGKFEKGRSLVISLEWNPYIAKLPPFSKFVFYKKPNWTKEKRTHGDVSFFNILEEITNDFKNNAKSVVHQHESKVSSNKIDSQKLFEKEDGEEPIINKLKLRSLGKSHVPEGLYKAVD